MKKSLVTAAATAGIMFTAFGASANAQENTYTVHPGDSLWKISQLNHVSINHLKDWNHLLDDRIYVNQKLSLTYTVKSGDSLWDLARTYGTTVSQLKSLNGLTSDLILIDQQLKIPASHISAPFSVSTAKNDTTSYVIQKGDSLSTIGVRYHLTVSELKSMNHLTSNKIMVGNILKLRSARNSASATRMSIDSDSAVETPTATTDSQTVEKHVTSAVSQTEEKSAAPAAAQTEEKSAAPATAQTEEKSAAPATAQTEEKSAAPAAAQTTKEATAPAALHSAEKPAATAAANVQAILNEAEKYMGTPYLWGGTTPSGFDCSGFTQYVFAKYGISLPRTTAAQWGATTPVSSPSVGDLVFFQTYKSGPSHVGIYLGYNQFISATDSGVKISIKTSSYWGPRYLGARKAF